MQRHKADYAIDMTDAVNADLRAMTEFAKKTSFADKAAVAFREVMATVAAGPAMSYVVDTFAPSVGFLNSALSWSNAHTMGAARIFLAGAYGRMVSPLDPAAVLTPEKEADGWAMASGYATKYSVKFVCHAGAAAAVTYANEMLKPLYTHELEEHLFIAGATKAVAQIVELGVAQVGGCIASSLKARREMLARNSEFLATSVARQERKDPLKARLLSSDVELGRPRSARKG